MAEIEENSARRIFQATKWVELQPQFQQSAPATTLQSLPAKLALTTSVITARSGTTLGKGTIQLQTISKNSSGVATYAASPQAVQTAYSISLSTIASGTLVGYKICDGILLIDLMTC